MGPVKFFKLVLIDILLCSYAVGLALGDGTARCGEGPAAPCVGTNRQRPLHPDLTVALIEPQFSTAVLRLWTWRAARAWC
jgi:hypothetical protein